MSLWALYSINLSVRVSRTTVYVIKMRMDDGKDGNRLQAVVERLLQIVTASKMPFEGLFACEMPFKGQLVGCHSRQFVGCHSRDSLWNAIRETAVIRPLPACTSVDTSAIIHTHIDCVDSCARLIRFATSLTVSRKKWRNYHLIVSLQSHFETHNDKPSSSMSVTEHRVD